MSSLICFVKRNYFYFGLVGRIANYDSIFRSCISFSRFIVYSFFFEDQFGLLVFFDGKNLLHESFLFSFLMKKYEPFTLNLETFVKFVYEVAADQI